MYLLIIFLPLLSTIVSCLLGRWVGAVRVWVFSTSCLFLAFFLSCVAFYEVGLCATVCTIEIGTWFDIGLFFVPWGFLFDSLTVSMLIVVTSVSSLVHFYSGSYMAGDPHLSRFMGYLSLFTFFMLMLVTGDNLLQLFLGWEGVGLASYLLINFWFTRIQANKAAIKAMMLNRVGDIGLTFGIALIFLSFKTMKYGVLFAVCHEYTTYSFMILGSEFNLINAICFFLFIGAVGKSAQLGLHVWLPDAMEGPTPVSALIHAATMVTAGVFLLVRCSPFIEVATVELREIIITIGALTAFFAATTGMLQHDMKKVIAYSTCSQLGYMVFACGLSCYSAGMFHLINHAFFKALLFLSAGSVIHALSDEQDMRKMGGLVRMVPMTYTMIVIGSLALMGFPFLTGFYSKDLILELAFGSYSNFGHFAFWLGTLAAFFTAFYSFRLIYLVFIGPINGELTTYRHVHDAPPILAFPLLVLGIASIFAGYMGRDLFVGLGSTFWGNAIFTLPEHLKAIDAEFVLVNYKLIPFIFSMTGASLAMAVYHFLPAFIFAFKKTPFARDIFYFLNRKWFFDRIYNEWLAQPALWVGYTITFKTLDKGGLEYFGPAGLAALGNDLAHRFGRFQTGFLFHYAFIILLSILGFAFLSLFNGLPLELCVVLVLFFIKDQQLNNR